MYRKDRSVIWTEVVATWVTDVNWQIEGALGVIRDITERKKAEEKLQELYSQERELRQQIEAEMQSRIEFTRALAHELRTPLTPVLASIDSLPEEIKDKRLLKLAGNISRGASTLNKRIEELLDLAKGEVGLLQLKLESIDLLPMLRQIGESMAPMASRRGQTLTLDLPLLLPLVKADEARLQQVIANLLDNAFKFTPQGGKIKLRAREQDSSIVIEVQDNGPGMSKEQQEGLFEPYHRAVSNTGSAGGLGLGLALCKSFVELHGGQIWVKSRIGKGSTVRFSLPLQNTRWQTATSKKGKLWKVLIIEDDPTIVDSISMAFEKDWPEADLISTGMGEDGAEMAETRDPDIIILDLGLPDIDGFEVLRRVRLFSSVPIVILTVKEEESDITRALEWGAEDYITKPFRKKELLARLKAQLRRRTTSSEEAPIVCGALRLDTSTSQLTYGAKQISLTIIEGHILKHLMMNAGYVVPHSRLAEAVWGEDYPGAVVSLRTHILSLRQKLEADSSDPRIILTKAGVGYSLAKPS